MLVSRDHYPLQYPVMSLWKVCNGDTMWTIWIALHYQNVNVEGGMGWGVLLVQRKLHGGYLICDSCVCDFSYFTF